MDCCWNCTALWAGFPTDRPYAGIIICISVPCTKRAQHDDAQRYMGHGRFVIASYLLITEKKDDTAYQYRQYATNALENMKTISHW
eukprot:6319493-Amphidinium_carterae.1